MARPWRHVSPSLARVRRKTNPGGGRQ
jgi:hypothetical protein